MLVVTSINGKLIIQLEWPNFEARFEVITTPSVIYCTNDVVAMHTSLLFVSQVS